MKRLLTGSSSKSPRNARPTVTTAHAIQGTGQIVHTGSTPPAAIPATAKTADTSPNRIHSVRCRRASSQAYTPAALLGLSPIHH